MYLGEKPNKLFELHWIYQFTISLPVSTILWIAESKSEKNVFFALWVELPLSNCWGLYIAITIV